MAWRAAAGTESNQWTPCGWGGGGFYWCTAFHPTQDGVIYMGGDVNGVYKSADHGRTWRMINHGLADYGVYSLAVHSQMVYAATESGLCKSTDAGEHWQTLPHTGRKELRLTGERNKSIRAVAVDPADDKIVYAASPAGKVYKSTDGGQTWQIAYEKPVPAEDTASVRVQFGKVTGDWHGGLWFPISGGAPEGCTGLGLTFKGGGAMPKDCFLSLKLANGTSYRSKNLRELFKDTQWRDVVLRAEDFTAEAKAATAPLDWSAVVRLDFACVNPPGEAVAGYFKQFYFAAAQPRVFCDTAKLKKGAAYANIRMGAASEGSIYSVAVAALEGEAPAEPMRKTNAPHGSPGGSPSNGRAKKSTLVVAATETSGLVLSDDAGKTWRELAAPKKAAHVAIATDPNVMYGAFFADGVWKTIDQGKTWTKCPLVAKKVVEVVISPVNPQDVYAIGAADWNGQFYASHDGGQTWTTTSQLKHDLAADPTLPEDGGGLSTPTNLALNPFNPRELFISANWRPCWSDDAGQTWTERDAGADITCTQDIQFHDGRVYVAAMDEGTLVSADNGAHWRQLWPLKYSTELSGHNWRVALNSNRIIAASSPWQYGVANRVVVSEDGGKTCQSIATGLPNYIPSANTMWGRGYARALAVDPQNPQIVYLGIDGDPSDGKAGGGVFKSTDGGLTWKQLPHQPGSRRVFFGLAVDPTNSQRVYWAACGNAGGLWRSEDGGASWQHVFKNEGWPFNLLVTGDGTVYCPGRNLWRSTDHGKTWKQLTKHTGDGVIVGLECDPRDPKRLWYSTVTWGGEAEGGVFKTVDGGTTWQEITGNIPYRKPLVLRFNPATEELWAGGVGLYRIKQPK